MGNSAGTEGGGSFDNDNHLDEFDGVETLGYRVLGVQPSSPASAAGLVSFFDFIVGANGEPLLASGEGLEEGEEYDDVDFPALLQQHKGKAVELLVWNIKSQEQRFVDLTPDDNWGGAGLLGVTIRLDNYGGADERLIRVLEVEDGSPASIAGLVSLHDFLLGTNVVAFESTETLAAVLHQHVNQIVELYVYNSESDVVRVVPLMPSLSWGGDGLLGAEVGTGYLHRLPGSCRSTPGSSVERKVRWINREEAGNSANGGDNDNHVNSSNTTTAATGRGGAAGSVPDENTPLQLEPHLEMEVEQGDDSRRPEDVTKQPHQLGEAIVAKTPATDPSQTSSPGGNSSKAATTTSNPEQPSQQQQEQSQQQMPPSAASNNTATTATTTTTTQTHQFPAALPPLPPPPQGISSPVTPIKLHGTADEAAALFSGPPPAAGGSSFLPPPPKMMT